MKARHSRSITDETVQPSSLSIQELAVVEQLRLLVDIGRKLSDSLAMKIEIGGHSNCDTAELVCSTEERKLAQSCDESRRRTRRKEEES